MDAKQDDIRELQDVSRESSSSDNTYLSSLKLEADSFVPAFPAATLQNHSYVSPSDQHSQHFKWAPGSYDPHDAVKEEVDDEEEDDEDDDEEDENEDIEVLPFQRSPYTGALIPQTGFYSFHRKPTSPPTSHESQFFHESGNRLPITSLLRFDDVEEEEEEDEDEEEEEEG